MCPMIRHSQHHSFVSLHHYKGMLLRRLKQALLWYMSVIRSYSCPMILHRPYRSFALFHHYMGMLLRHCWLLL